MPLPSKGHSSCCSRPVRSRLLLHEALVELHAGLICERPKHKDAEDAATNLAERLERKIFLILIGDVRYPTHFALATHRWPRGPGRSGSGASTWG